MSVPNDIDLLIVHPDTDTASCQFAIVCKRRLSVSIDHVHITMLSDSEEQHCQFINTTQAVRLGTIQEQYIDDDLRLLQIALRMLASPRKRQS